MTTTAQTEENLGGKADMFRAAAEAFERTADALIEKIESGEVTAQQIKAKPITNFSPPTKKEQAAAKRAAKAGDKSKPALEREVKLKSRALTDEEIFNKCALFMDGATCGPIFISPPINRKIYVAHYPRAGEMLSAQRILALAPKNADEETIQLFSVFGELQEAVYGWTFDNDPAIDVIKANLTDPKQWPELRKFRPLESRDPRVSIEVGLLWKEYLTWKARVTPTDDELEKYYGLVN